MAQGVFDIEVAAVPSDRPFLLKAQENFRCASIAMEKEWHNAAASRFFYAMFLAGVEYMRVCGKVPKRPARGGGNRWDKSELAECIGVCSGQLAFRSNYENANLLRVRADYKEVPIAPGQTSRQHRDAREFLSFVFQQARESRPEND